MDKFQNARYWIEKRCLLAGAPALLANAALVHHLGNVTVPCQPSGGWLAAVLGTVLSAALHVDGLS